MFQKFEKKSYQEKLGTDQILAQIRLRPFVFMWKSFKSFRETYFVTLTKIK